MCVYCTCYALLIFRLSSFFPKILFPLEVAYSELQVIEGREAQLACNNSALVAGSLVSSAASTGSSSSSITRSSRRWIPEEPVQIYWFRGSSTLPFFVVDARNGSSLRTALLIPSPEYAGRVTFESDPIPSLKIKKVLRTDEGEFRCRSVFRRSRTQKCLINVNVVSKCCSFIVFSLFFASLLLLLLELQSIHALTGL